jgi:hypothetical protein
MQSAEHGCDGVNDCTATGVLFHERVPGYNKVQPGDPACFRTRYTVTRLCECQTGRSASPPGVFMDNGGPFWTSDQIL